MNIPQFVIDYANYKKTDYRELAKANPIIRKTLKKKINEIDKILECSEFYTIDEMMRTINRT